MTQTTTPRTVLDHVTPPAHLAATGRHLRVLTGAGAGILAVAALFGPAALAWGLMSLLLVLSGAALLTAPARSRRRLEDVDALHRAADTLDASGVPTAVLDDVRWSVALPPGPDLRWSPAWLLMAPVVALALPAWLTAALIVAYAALSVRELPALTAHAQMQFRVDVLTETLLRRSPVLTDGADFEGTCVGCGARSAHLNRDTLCRTCVTDPARQTLPVQPE